MLLTDDQVRAILARVSEQTANDALVWSGRGGRMRTRLPNRSVVELIPDEAGPGLTARIREGREVYGEVRDPAGAGSPTSLLYRAAQDHAARNVYAEIMEALDVAGLNAARPATPPRAAPDQATVLAMMAGTWTLEAELPPTDRVRIDPAGRYFVGNSPLVKYTLTILAWNPAERATTVAKDTPEGERLQIEYLTLSADELVGHVKHDGRPLHYRRLKK